MTSRLTAIHSIFFVNKTKFSVFSMDRMNIASPVGDSGHESNNSCPEQNSRHQEQGSKSKGIENHSTEVRHTDPSGRLTTLAEHDESIKSKSEKADMKLGAKKNSNKLLQNGKKASQRLRDRRYFLRSSQDGVRVLRSMSKGKSKTPAESVSHAVNPTTKRRKKRRKVKEASNDEFSVTRKRVRYLLTRMNYEQSLIDAYSNEGWKGQSLEKIKPEKELERAKSEILRCKLKIRESFQCLDSLLSEGRLEESLFDSDGQICSEDIFCAKCGSKDLSVDNDILLCDGTCDRGFHQKCLNPPLLSENVPAGDEGWLCPACDCKVDCIDLLNEFQGSNLSIEDSWEKVFPEATAIASGDKPYDFSNLPSDDSEDNDYDPDVPEVVIEDCKEESSSEEDHEEESSFEESYFTNSSEDSGPSKQNSHYDDIGLPSDDSEDDDYDPEGPYSDKEIQKEGSSPDESDFTSDSDDFCAELSKIGGTDKVSAFSLPDLKPQDPSGEEECVGDRNENARNSGLPSMMEPDPSQVNASPVPGKRQHEHLDYKKLYDETYDKASSGSSDDEDWTDKSALKKGKKSGHVEESDVLPKTRSQSIKTCRSSGRAKRKTTEEDTVTKSDFVESQVSLAVNENTSKKARQQNLQSASLRHSVAQQNKNPQEPDSNGNKATTSVQRHFGPVVTQKLYESFNENQYPSRETKERLAEEFGMTIRQISKWFENSRHSMRVSVKEAKHAVTPTSDEGTSLSKTKRNNDQPDKGTVKNSAGNGSKGKKSGSGRNNKVGGGHSSSSGQKMKGAQDNNRMKAIERELRKMRKRM